MVLGFMASGITAIIAVGAPAIAIIAAISAAIIGLGVAIAQVIRYWDEFKIAFNSMGWKDWFVLIYDIGKAMVKFILNPIRSVYNIFKKMKGWVSGGRGGESPVSSGGQPGAGIGESKSRTDINIKV